MKCPLCWIVEKIKYRWSLLRGTKENPLNEQNRNLLRNLQI